MVWRKSCVGALELLVIEEEEDEEDEECFVLAK